MTTLAKLIAGLAVASSASPAFAGASSFTIVNGTELAMGALTIRRVGTQEWKRLGSAPSAGARGAISFSDPDCAFDIQAAGAGGKPVTWAGVNLCDVKSVILRSDGSAGAWVDYDQ